MTTVSHNVKKKQQLAEYVMATTTNKPAPNTDIHNTFQHAISSVLVTAQCFGVMPVMGVTGPSAACLRFRWFTFRTVFSIITCLGAGLNMALSFMVMSGGITFAQSDSAVFFGSVTAMYLLFLQVAREWPGLAIEWENLELSQRHYGYTKHLNRKIKIITTVIMVGALVEHVLSKASRVVTAASCTDNLYDLLQHYFTKTGTYNQIFTILEYNVVTAIITLITNFIATFVWNFTDLFIILVSISLAGRFRLFNCQLQTHRGKILPESFWSQIRQEYNELSFLTRSLDSCISKIILVSFGNNVYFICRQLLYSLNPMDGAVETAYFCWSFGFMLFRTMMLSLYAASIYDESRLPRLVLYSVPPESYQTEVSRLLIQIMTDNIALTGMNFFRVTRTMILTLAGTIVTYEIVLVQFNSLSILGASPQHNNSCSCN